MVGMVQIMMGYGGNPPLSASASPTSVFGTKVGPTAGTATSNSTTVTATGGDGSYTYAWSQVSGDTINCTSPTAATTAFSAFVSSSVPTKTGVYRCTVTDGAGNTATADVDVSLDWTSGT